MKNLIFKFLFLTILTILITEITKSVLNLDKLIYSSLSEQLTTQQIEDFLNLQNKWQWLGYFFAPVMLLIKTTLITSVIYVGTFFFSKKEAQYKILWDIVIKAEFIFLLVPFFKLIMS